MKKRIVCLLMILTCLIMLGGCGEKAKTEYDINEFSEMLEDIVDDCANEFQDLTDDERNENQEEIASKRKEIFIKHYKNNGLEVGQEIIISGNYSGLPKQGAFVLQAEEDTDFKFMVIGQFKDDIKEFPKENEAVRIKGILTEDPVCIIDECELVSP